MCFCGSKSPTKQTEKLVSDLEPWFDAAKRNDVSFLQQNLEQFKKTVILNPNSRYCGFTAFHIACFFDSIEAAELLLPLEGGEVTRRQNHFEAPGISPSAKFTLPPYSSAIMIALLRNSQKCV